MEFDAENFQTDFNKGAMSLKRKHSKLVGDL